MIYKKLIYKKFILFFGLIGVLLLSGCDTLKTPRASERFEQKTPLERQTALTKIKFWKIYGAFSIRQERQKPEIADYSWDQQGSKNYRIVLSSPMDLYHVTISRRMGSVTLWKNGTHAFNAKTPEGLMQKALGWSLPVRALSVWIKGMPDLHAGKYAAGYDTFGHLTVLHQKGWTLHFGAYRRNEEYGVDLPQIITLERPGFFVKIIVKNWMLYMQPYSLPNIM